MNDPFSLFDRMDPFARMGMASYGRQQQAPQWEPLPEQEAESLKDSLLRKGVSGLQYVGGTLDKAFGGRAIRGALAGNWRDVASLVPFSDSVGLTDRSKMTTGDDLLKKWGMWTPNNPNKVELRDFFGAGVEMALDPGTFFLGPTRALTKAGRAAELTGQLPRSLAQRMQGFDRIASKTRLSPEALKHAQNQGQFIASKETEQAAKALGTKINVGAPLGGAFGFGLPFGGPSVALGTGQWARPIGKGYDTTLDFMRHGNWLGRNLSAAFDPDVVGAVDAEAQRSARNAFRPTSRRLTQEGKAVEYDLLRQMRPFAGTANEEAALKLMREIGERGDNPGGGFITPVDPKFLGPRNLKTISQAGDQAAQRSRQVFMERRAQGAPIKQGGDEFADHLPRQSRAAFENAQGAQMDRGKPFGMTSGANIPRVFHDIPGGAAQVDQWAMRFAGDRSRKVKDVAADVLGDMLRTATNEGHAITQQLTDAFEKTAARVAKELRGMDPVYRLEQKSFFQPDPIRDLGRQTQQHARAMGAAESVYDVIRRKAGKLVPGDETQVPITTFLRQLGMPTYSRVDEFGTPIPGIEGALVRAWESLAPHGAGPVETLMNSGQKNLRGLFERNVGQYGIPRSVAEQFTRSYNKWVEPEQMIQPLRAWDWMANRFKDWTYTAWLPSHIRNLGSALWMNLPAMTRPGDYLDQARIMAGRAPRNPVPGVRESLSDQAKLDLIRQRQYASSAGSVYGGHNATTDAMTGVQQSVTPDQLMRVMPGDFSGIADNLHVRDRATWNPVSDRNWWIRGHRRLGTVIEDLVRGSQWLGNVRRGATDDVAARLVDKYHFNYGDLTDFERKVMKRIIPFYCVPASHEILTRVGWKTYDRLRIGEPVLSLDHDSGQLEWVPLEDVAVFDYDGELWTIERKRSKHNFQFTPDHRWPVVTKSTTTKGKHYPSKRKMKRANEINSSDLIPLTGEFKDNGHSVLTPRLAAILGWVVTDGYHRWRGSHCEMLIYQSPGKFLDRILELTNTKPRAPHPDTGVVAVPVSLEDSTALRQLYKSDADLPWIVSHLSRDAAEAMWDAMFQAEGWIVPETGQQGFAQDPDINPAVLDAFQILSLMTGRSANKNGRGAYIGRIKHLDCKEGFGRTHYTGKIWCPKTKHGTWVMRHNGATVITGNTFMRKNLPLQLETAMNRPGQLSAPLRTMSTAMNQRDYIPEYIASGVAIPYGESPTGEQRFITQLGLPFEEAFGRFHFSGGLPDWKRTAMAFASGINPYIKGPLEQLTGKQFYSGRDLDDLRAPGLAQAVNPFDAEYDQPVAQFLSNTPLTRFVTTADRMVDPRKGILEKLVNLGSGIRISDIDAEKYRAIDAREALEARLDRRPNIRDFTNYYVRPEELAMLTPQDQVYMRLYANLKADARAYAEEQERKRQQLIGVRSP